MTPPFASFLTIDFVYKQNPDGSYVFDETGGFLLENNNGIIDTFLRVLREIYINIVKNKQINPGRIECNEYLLYQALTRYSRDIFGERRLDAKINWLGKIGRLTPQQRSNLENYSDYGFKVDSCNPYIHRRLSNLLYWLSVLKPFAIHPEDNGIIKPLGVAFEFHNEYMSYLLSLAMLRPFNKTITIHNNRNLFADFLYELHFRSISRSSLEFCLNEHISEIDPPH